MIGDVHDILWRDPHTCTPICRVVIEIESLARPIGPAGDAIYMPLGVAGGRVEGIGSDKQIVGGADIAVAHADEKIAHQGMCVVADPAGNIIIWFEGTSQAEEGAYDDLLDGVYPPRIRSRLAVRIASTNPEWRSFDRRPLIGAGSFDANAGVLEFVILSLVEQGALN
jgi:hypothetical protein